MYELQEQFYNPKDFVETNTGNKVNKKTIFVRQSADPSHRGKKSFTIRLATAGAELHVQNNERLGSYVLVGRKA
ncbi:hypothetical protein BV898_16398 [Hypsibius exemplaris]|uniref:Uncharacterized protein n=1 Tax=Hypsibius exemplaris TaxID=2072580 RepID=A0A9X6NFT1_HYPEX|nr:hypothetical protein BV898_16398 [Hypsibius exemplaris]